MKNQKKQLLVLCILLILGVIACVIVVKNNKANAKEDTDNRVRVFSCDASEVTAFSYQVDQVTYSFVKNQSGWTCEQDSSIVLDDAKVKTLLSNLTDVSAEEEITDYKDINEYGFEEPVNVISVTANEQKTVFTIGSDNEILKQTYMTIGDGTQVNGLYLMDSTFASAFCKVPQDLAVEDTTEETETTPETTEEPR